MIPAQDVVGQSQEGKWEEEEEEMEEQEEEEMYYDTRRAHARIEAHTAAGSLNPSVGTRQELHSTRAWGHRRGSSAI